MSESIVLQAPDGSPPVTLAQAAVTTLGPAFGGPPVPGTMGLVAGVSLHGATAIAGDEGAYRVEVRRADGNGFVLCGAAPAEPLTARERGDLEGER